MRKFISTQLGIKPLIIVAAALTTAVPATADDIDVFNAILSSQNKPNILFVLDYSGSMKRDVYDDDIPSGDTTTLSKIDILKSAVNTLLLSNQGKVNVGLGSLYEDYASGIRWPISDLEADASTLDPAIPSATVTVADVISSQLDRTSPNDSTATVNALAEAAAYFRGGDVLHHDRPISRPWSHQPDRWDSANNQYNWGNREAAVAASYTPTDAYQFGVSNGGYEYCTDTIDGYQGCDGKTTYDCSFQEGGEHSSSGGPDGGGGSWTSSDRTVCKYVYPDSWATPQYVSPLTQQCQANFIVLISDGQPTRLNQNTTIENVLKDSGVASGLTSDCNDLSTTTFSTSSDTSDEGNCGPEILEYLATTNINPNIEDSHVTTFTVGFAVDGPGKNYLKLLAEKGNGDFYEATQPEDLTVALNSVIDSILAGSQNFAELAVDVNPSTYSHDDRTYFSLFSPSSRSGWKGNLKGFFLDETGLIDVKGNAAVVDNGKGTQFADTSHSFWSSVPDGNDVVAGGASQSITDLPPAPNTRNIYTYLGGDKNLIASNDGVKLNKDNKDIDDKLMGDPGDALREASLDWIANAPMGDPLHTKPVVITYKDSVGVETRVIYIMTNQGLLHAFDASTPTVPDSDQPDLTGGNELFAFMPKELLSNLPELYSPTLNAEHVYGLDGNITRWHNDTNKDGRVNPGESVQLVFGMRRGGANYYSLDVSNPLNPKFNWQIDPSDSGFSKLAQTWSRASLVTVKTGSSTKERVLMFGGGYDAAIVDGTTAPTAASGNAVFMVDHKGDHVWSIDDSDHPDMNFSIPSDLTIIDTDRDGAADRAYFGDLGGQVWRVDFDDITQNSETTVTKFADVKNNNHQPIFYAPSVSKARRYGEQYYAVAFGTGDRTQPMLDTTENALFMLKDVDYEVGPPDIMSTTILATNSSCTVENPCGIYDATDNDIGSSDETVSDAAKDLLRASKGWTVKLLPGEKALSKVVTFEGKYMATTFQPAVPLTESGDPDPCSFAMTGRLYVMNVADARPIEILSDGSETTEQLDKMNRVTVLNGTTIPSSPVIVFPADSSQVQIIVDKESVVAVNKQVSTVYWHAK